MGHHITALVIKGPFDPEMAEEYDLRPVPLPFDLTLFHIDHYYSAVWQKRLGLTGLLVEGKGGRVIIPDDMSIAFIAGEISEQPQAEFAIIVTDYFGGMGDQFGGAFKGEKELPGNDGSISTALRILGVIRKNKLDEFDTVGLSDIRSNPEYLDKYTDLAEELGV